MPRTVGIVVPAIPYHVTQRRNRRDDVFFSDEDRRIYLDLLYKYSQQHGMGMDVLAYCLMTNHVHWVVLPHGADSLAGTLKPLRTSVAGTILLVRDG